MRRIQKPTNGSTEDIAMKMDRNNIKQRLGGAVNNYNQGSTQAKPAPVRTPKPTEFRVRIEKCKKGHLLRTERIASYRRKLESKAQPTTDKCTKLDVREARNKRNGYWIYEMEDLESRIPHCTDIQQKESFLSTLIDLLRQFEGTEMLEDGREAEEDAS